MKYLLKQAHKKINIIVYLAFCYKTHVLNSDDFGMRNSH